MDNVINLSEDATSGPHPFSIFLDGFSDEVEAPEYVIDGVVAAGTVCIAGERGLGKTSALVPLTLACTGLLINYPLKASIRRKVVYVAEDVAQVRRIIAAMREAGLVTADRDEFNDWFKLVEAKRLPVHEIVGVVPHLDDLWSPNSKVDHTTYLAPPVVVLDTTNATINLDNISDNAEVSRAVSSMRQQFGRIPLVLVGHVAKASRSDAKQLSFIGAGSWEGDTQQSIYLVCESDQRYMVLGKRRFEPEVSEYRILSHMSVFDAVDKLGHTVEIRCFYGIPEATSQEDKEEAKAKAMAEQKAKTWAGMKKKVLVYVTDNPESSTRDIVHSVSGNNAEVGHALRELVDTGQIEVEKDGQTNRHKKGTDGNTHDDPRFD